MLRATAMSAFASVVTLAPSMAAVPQTFRFPDGSSYRGGVEEGMQHGEGEWRSAEGDVYVGGFG